MTAHQQELEEIMEKMDLEKQRQQANLHQKLLERKKRKQEAQQRKQEREMAKELLEQKRELQEVRTQHVSGTCSVERGKFEVFLLWCVILLEINSDVSVSEFNGVK